MCPSIWLQYWTPNHLITFEIIHLCSIHNDLNCLEILLHYKYIITKRTHIHVEHCADKRAALNPLDMVLSVTHGFIEYCGIHCYVHQWFDVSFGGLLKAHSTEGSYCDSTQLRALIGSGPFFPDVLPTLGLKWLTLPTEIHKHTRELHR